VEDPLPGERARGAGADDVVCREEVDETRPDSYRLIVDDTKRGMGDNQGDLAFLGVVENDVRTLLCSDDRTAGV
jgi:hypothetical protein